MYKSPVIFDRWEVQRLTLPAIELVSTRNLYVGNGVADGRPHCDFKSFQHLRYGRCFGNDSQ